MERENQATVHSLYYNVEQGTVPRHCRDSRDYQLSKGTHGGTTSLLPGSHLNWTQCSRPNDC